MPRLLRRTVTVLAPRGGPAPYANRGELKALGYGHDGVKWLAVLRNLYLAHIRALDLDFVTCTAVPCRHSGSGEVVHGRSDRDGRSKPCVHKDRR